MSLAVTGCGLKMQAVSVFLRLWDDVTGCHRLSQAVGKQHWLSQAVG
jgi:hypothetical protein